MDKIALMIMQICKQECEIEERLNGDILNDCEIHITLALRLGGLKLRAFSNCGKRAS